MTGWTKAFALPALAALAIAVTLGVGACTSDAADPGSEQEPTYGPPATVAEMQEAGIPADLIPANTAGRGLVSVTSEPENAAEIDAASTPVFVRAEFEGGLLVQASSDPSTRPDPAGFGDRAILLEESMLFSSVGTDAVGGATGIVTEGELPMDLVDPSEWSKFSRGSAVQWSDDVWFYNVWIDGESNPEAVLEVARSIGQ